MKRIRVIADSGIPFLKGVLEPFCDVVYMAGSAIDHKACTEADALIIRIRTKCVTSLLEGTRVSFIDTATIGTDHIDIEYLHKAGISYANAPGCNACGVMQYVHTALFSVAARRGIDLRGKVLGVIGAGNTGERVARFWEHLGGKALRNDIDISLKAPLVSLEYLLKNSDIVSCHVPLTPSTRGMVGERFMETIKPGAILVNSCRGEVFDDEAVLKHRNRLSALIVDVWNGEPKNIERRLIDASDVATPHIAGYSYEGKVNGTTMAVRAFARHFGIEALKGFTAAADDRKEIPLEGRLDSLGSQARFAEELLAIFPLWETDAAFRTAPTEMERQRSEYDYRHEFKVPETVAEIL